MCVLVLRFEEGKGGVGSSIEREDDTYSDSPTRLRGASLLQTLRRCVTPFRGFLRCRLVLLQPGDVLLAQVQAVCAEECSEKERGKAVECCDHDGLVVPRQHSAVWIWWDGSLQLNCAVGRYDG